MIRKATKAKLSSKLKFREKAMHAMKRQKNAFQDDNKVLSHCLLCMLCTMCIYGWPCLCIHMFHLENCGWILMKFGKDVIPYEAVLKLYFLISYAW
jgi:hypothetical protein